MQYPHILQEKFDHFQICTNNTQHVATFRNTSQQAGQTHATCYAQQCYDHLVGTQVSQLSNTKCPNIVGPVFANSGQMIATFKHNISQHCLEQHVARVWPPLGHPVTTSWVLKSKLVRMPGRNIFARNWSNDYNIMQLPQMLHEKCDHVEICLVLLVQI